MANVAIATIQARVLEVVGARPYTTDTTYGTRLTNIVTDVFLHLNSNLTWWYTREGKTKAAGNVDDELTGLAYNLACAYALIDIGAAEKAQPFLEVYKVLRADFDASFQRTGGVR